MKNKKRLVYLSKILISGILAFSILTLFCYIYYNIPAHSICEDGATDYTWEASVFRSRGTEGFSWGKTNNEGYNNLFDFSPANQIDILIIGSSHMEAFQVAADESVSSLLNSMLPDDLVYNIGVSSHNFLTCVCNLEAALNKYQPTKYVIMETGTINFSDSNVRKALDGTLPEASSHTEGIIGLIQHNQFLRLMGAQIQHYLKNQNINDDITENAPTDSSSSNNKLLLNELLSKISLISQNNNVQLVVLYHPSIKVCPDGSMQISQDEETISNFERLCFNNNIIFLDMSNRFLQEYEKDYTLPYGFANSSVGSGHLNKHGHAMIAEELYKLILEGE